VFEKTCAPSQKNVKSHGFWIFKKTFKNKKRNHLVIQPLITQLPVPVSHGHQHQTSCSEVWAQETMQVRTARDKCL